MWVDGDRKCTLSIKQVITKLELTRTKTKIKYLPNRGRQCEVEGMISKKSKKRKVSEIRMDMANET